MTDDEVRFGQFRFHLGRRQLFRDECPLRLGGRALDVLHTLVAAKGDVVSKEELLARVWPGLVVEENNLQVQVSLLRKTLETSGESHLVTVPGRGYRLVGLKDTQQGLALPDSRCDRTQFELHLQRPRRRCETSGSGTGCALRA